MELQWFDISREMTTAPVYPGDPFPSIQRIADIHLGDDCNTSVLHACVHTGTHMDAPRHFLPEGQTIDQIPLDICCGPCIVREESGLLVGAQVEKYLWMLSNIRRLLFKGDVQLTPSAATEIACSDVRLIGVENTSVASAQYTSEVHRVLLDAGVVILEGLDLSAIKPGRYELVAAPIKLAGCDGAPVRAMLARQPELSL